MDYGYVFRRAWQIIWKFKVLWIFGILAGCGQAGGSGGGNSGYRFSGRDNISPQVNQWFNQLSPTAIVLLITLAIIVVLVLTVVAITLGSFGRIGLIRGTVKAEQGAQRLTFSELWRESQPYFWRVFGLYFVIVLILITVGVILTILAVVFSVATLGIGLLCLIPLICLLIPIFWIFSIIIEQIYIALVVENLSIGEAIEHGWRLVWNNIGTMIVMGLILFVGINLIGGFIIGLPVIAVLAPAAAGFINGSNTAIRNGLITSAILFLIYLPFLLALSGLLRSYTISAWTLTYMRITHPTVQAAPITPLPPEAPQPPLAPETPEVPKPPEPATPPENPEAQGG